MAKKPKTEPQDTAAAFVPPAGLVNTSELVADGANPRKISDEGAAGLKASIERFGDLSGIVFNTRTGELVAGHRRIEQIRAAYGDRQVELIDAAAGLYGIRVDEGHYFPVRVVDWSRAVQRAANVAANNTKIQGRFTGELSAYLLSVEAELAEEMPGVLDDCLMVELMAAGLDASDASEKETVEFDAAGAEKSYQVIVQCTDKEHQKRIYEQLIGEGLACTALTL